MQIVCKADNLHEMSTPLLWGKKKENINLLSAEFAQGVVKVKQICTSANDWLAVSFICSRSNSDIFLRLVWKSRDGSGSLGSTKFTL